MLTIYPYTICAPLSTSYFVMTLSRTASTDSLVLLAAQLHLEGVCELQDSRKGKGRHDAKLPDDDFAMDLYAALLAAEMQSLSDHRVALSPHQAVGTDADLLEEIAADELRAQRDREWALRLSRDPSAAPSRQPSSGGSGIQSPVRDSSKGSRRGTNVPPRTDSSSADRNSCCLSRVRCTACNDNTTTLKSIIAPCSHPYCNGCITELFTSAMTNETLMPPRCCRVEIPLTLVARLLGVLLVGRFTAKVQEFGTKNRLYCPISTCSAFIGSASDQKGVNVACPRCFTMVCAYCKTTVHPSWEECSDDKDEASQLVLALGEREGWRRCRTCKRLVELSLGWYITLDASAVMSSAMSVGRHGKNASAPFSRSDI
ncbi:hypothetical protein DL93DRAFT_2176131 [Clavulina sp. PMI_390]|nr:hypothetical protein DL93DRAFT_2176131 [Clavulina sp. PMI_390]